MRRQRIEEPAVYSAELAIRHDNHEVVGSRLGRDRGDDLVDLGKVSSRRAGTPQILDEVGY